MTSFWEHQPSAHPAQEMRRVTGRVGPWIIRLYHNVVENVNVNQPRPAALHDKYRPYQTKAS
ncbi:MAG: hypothetical protein GTN81_14520 [Proteobacteria bacterium]|nr:hypothetical protein [Pseudomonadota bacterium]